LSYWPSEILFACVCVCLSTLPRDEEATLMRKRHAVVPHYMLCCSNRCVGATAAAAATAQRAFFAFSTTVRIPQRDDRMIKRHKNPPDRPAGLFEIFFRTNFFLFVFLLANINLVISRYCTHNMLFPVILIVTN
jgi:hypothetical protein